MSANYAKIGELYDKAGTLAGVRYSVYDSGPEGRDWIDAVEMRFEYGVVASIYADADFDTIRLELSSLLVREACYVIDATSAEPWVTAVGRSSSWIWLLRNQQGYEDGLRFEFSRQEQAEKKCVVTLVVIASELKVYSSQEVNLSTVRSSDNKTA
jgi:Family of unknown function (DUF6334)